jgi:predicted RNA binding protein YcfA (HicA-like mRNA interferase family)
VTAREVVRRLLDHGCTKVRQKGSHARFASPCGKCAVTVPMHAGRVIPRGTLKSIERAMEPCLGPNWLSG